MIRVVIDTNIFVRAISGRSFSNFIFDLLFNNQITLCVSTDILLEYEEIITKIYDSTTAELVIGALLLLPNVHRTEVYFDLRLIIQDADDDKFVNCAFATNAHCIVSDDRHFSVLDKIPFPKIPVLKFTEFKEFIKI
ncbi:putative toxin-antitoxin system toxin component, PIN family [Runella salmonicolor]|uniref:Toxin-antitoxin system toxin component, PIN family n=1 Tax=Runella salmonicolor TaxID=2950278 RepID=A0ABT1FHX7_9BACT|nr:putative toxin-antitoxin system toxin component, PIN family [Runella salmonicolor]MCP1381312.1 putative toxin-antitoxin system toxin component, PIN family [Runella salmonicolor]